MKKTISILLIIGIVLSSCVTKTITKTQGRGKHKTTTTIVKKHKLF